MAFSSGGGGFGGFGGGGFGQSQSIYGQQQQSYPFGGSSVFGQPSSSPFGVSSSGFGFGASQSGFGVSSSAFGVGGGGGTGFTGFGSPVNSQMAFGAQPASTGFAFGQSSGGFGVSQPAFGGGQPSSPFVGSSVFGRPQSSAAFGASGMGGFSAFGQSSSAFGFQPSSGFSAQQGSGTAIADWQKTPDAEGGSSGSTSQFMSITAMQQYQMKSVEELRLEDYRGGRKQQQGMQQQQNAPFMTSQSSAPFMSTFQQSSSPFSFSSSSFQPSSSAFGFGGGFSQPSFSSSAFNFNVQQSSSPFQTAAPASSAFNFSTSSSPFGTNVFQQSAPFGQSSQSPFNFQQSSAAFQPFQVSSQSFFSSQPQQFNPGFSSTQFAPFSTSTGIIGQQSAPSFTFQPIQQQQQQQQQQVPVQMPQINVNPYGSYPQLPVIPPPRHGITANKPATSKMPIMRAQAPARRISNLSLKSRMKGNQMLTESLRRLAMPSKELTGASTQASEPFKLTVRKPQKLFIREEIPHFPNTDDEQALYANHQHDYHKKDQEKEEEEEEEIIYASNSKDASYRILKFSSDSTPPKQQSVSLKDAVVEDSDGIDMDSLLPKVTVKGYYIRPSLAQLASMAQHGGEQELANVSNFTVGCEGLGSVVFLEPVDVRGVDVCALVRFVKGGIEVFYDMGDDTPEVGSSLNKAAEVTLLQLYQEDPQTKKPINDPASIEKFARKLKKACQKQNSEMISYDADLQRWKFRVMHFSKYGIAWEMPDQKDSDNEEEEEEDDDDDDDNNKDAQSPGSSKATEGLAEMKRALFSPPDPNSRRLTLLDIVDNDDEEEVEEVEEVVEEVEDIGDMGIDLSLGGQGEQQRGDLPADFESDIFEIKKYWCPEAPGCAIVYQHAIHMEDETCDVPMKYRKDQVQSGTLGVQQLSACFQDFGAAMRPTFRPSWGMHGILIVPGVRDGQNVIDIKQIFPGAVFEHYSGVSDKDRYYASYFPRQVSRIQGLLGVHKEFSEQSGIAEDECSSWKLQCDKNNVKDIVDKMCEVEQNIIKEARDIGHLETKQLMHEKSTWNLISVLFREITNKQQESQNMLVDEPQMEMYQQYQRNQLFTEWLKSSCKLGVESGVQLCNSVPSMLIHLLSGLQVGAAVSLASKCQYAGLPCLISNISRGIQKFVKQQALEKQLQIWEDTGLTPGFINNDMLTLLQLLCGNVHFAQQRYIASLQWHCALGLFYWNTQASNISEAVNMYIVEAESGNVAQPNPFYATQMQARAQGLVDTQCLILSLFAHYGQQKIKKAHNPLPTICEVAGNTPNKLDYITAWFIAEFLTTLDLIPVSQQQHDIDVVFRLCNSLISFVDIVGDSFQWCIYIAVHLPDNEQFEGLRKKLVQQLLQQHVEEWINDSAVLHELGIPQSWLEEAKGFWYKYHHQVEKQLSALQGCGKMREAHDLLFNQIGPQLFLGKQFQQLNWLCSQFQDKEISGGVELFQRYIELQQKYQTGNLKQIEQEDVRSLQYNLKLLQGDYKLIKENPRLWLVIQRIGREVQKFSRLWYVEEDEEREVKFPSNIISRGVSEESTIFEVDFIANNLFTA